MQIKLKNPLFIIALTLTIVLVIPRSYAFEFSLGKRYFDYGNGAINLDLVTHIKPKISYIITLSDDSEDTFFASYSDPGTKSGSKRTQSFINPQNLDKLPYYFVEIKSSIFFDQFELVIFSSETFLKYPTIDQAESFYDTATPDDVLKKFEAFTIALAGKLELDKPDIDKDDEFIEFMRKLQKYVKLLKERDFEEISKGFDTTLDTYSKVVK